MTTVPVDPFVLKDALLKIDADNFEAAVSEVRFTPSSSQQTFKGIAPNSSKTDTTLASWVCVLSFAQDWDEPASLANKLLENEGDTVAAEFIPRNGGPGSTKFTANITLVAPEIGGAVDAFATSSVTCGSDKPVRGTTV